MQQYISYKQIHIKDISVLWKSRDKKKNEWEKGRRKIKIYITLILNHESFIILVANSHQLATYY